MKKVLSFILALTLLISVANVFALLAFGEEIVEDGNAAIEGADSNDVNARAAGNVIDSGYITSWIGNDSDEKGIYWVLDNTGTLTISGKGNMNDFMKGEPWRYHSDKIQKVIICDGITSISYKAFSGYKKLAELYMPASVTEVDVFALDGCSNLSIIVDPANTSYYFKQNCLISASGWLYFGNKYSVIPDDGSIKGINNGAFCGCDGLTSVTIPDGVECIGEAAFENCSDLTEIYIPKSVDNIYYCDFSGNPKLTDIYCEAESKPEGWSDDWNKSNAKVHWGYKKSIPGDTDGDGKINTYDIVYLINHLIYEEDYPVNQNVDFDGDGKVNTYDAIYLLNHLIFEDEYPLL